MPNKYSKMTATQKEHWNKYNNNYAKKNYKSYTLKLSYEKDKDIIEYLAKNKISVSKFVRKMFDLLDK